jgi:hypothetical protein
MAKTTNLAPEPGDIPDDIRDRVVRDFGPERADAVYRDLLDRIPDGLPNGTRPRHLRCVLFLANGDLAALDRAIELCLQDPRDAILHAEYSTDSPADPVRLRDFAKPFDRSEIRGRRRGGRGRRES